MFLVKAPPLRLFLNRSSWLPLQISASSFTGKAEAGKNAYTIIYFIAIGLFVLEEFFVEPVINMIGESVLISILIKLVIVLGLKASEGFIERKVTKKQAFRDAIKDIV